MKKIYAFVLSFISAASFAQVASCSLDPVFIASNKDGIWPDSATNFVSGTLGMAYAQNLTVKVPKDTVTGIGTFCFNRVEVSSPTGINNFNLPPGLNLLAGPNVTVASGIYKFPGNANRCALITGTPTAAGSYTLQFKVQAFMTPAFSPCSNSPNVNGGSQITGPTTLTYYIINIAAAQGIKEEVSAKTLNISNHPNPANAKTSIRFYVKDEAFAKITVYNLLGSKVLEEKVKTVYGENNIELDLSGWNSGVYLYSIQYKNSTATRRMIVNPVHE